MTDQDQAPALYAGRLGLAVVVDAPLDQLGGRWIVVGPHGAVTTIALEPARAAGPT